MRNFHCILLAIVLISTPTLEAQDDLPVSQVVLFSNGFGYIEHTGSFTGDVELREEFRRALPQIVQPNTHLQALDKDLAADVESASNDRREIPAHARMAAPAVGTTPNRFSLAESSVIVRTQTHYRFQLVVPGGMTNTLRVVEEQPTRKSLVLWGSSRSQILLMDDVNKIEAPARLIEEKSGY